MYLLVYFSFLFNDTHTKTWKKPETKSNFFEDYFNYLLVIVIDLHDGHHCWPRHLHHFVYHNSVNSILNVNDYL